MTKISSSIEYSANQITAQWKRNYEFSESQEDTALQRLDDPLWKRYSYVRGDTIPLCLGLGHVTQNIAKNIHPTRLKTATSAATSLASCVQVPPDKAWPLVSRCHPTKLGLLCPGFTLVAGFSQGISVISPRIVSEGVLEYSRIHGKSFKYGFSYETAN